MIIKFHYDPLKGGITPQREIIQILKNTGQLFFDAESICEISGNGRADARKHGRTNPNQYAPSTFSKLGA